MGIDFLELSFGMEKRLGVRFRPQHLMIDGHTTVGELAELVWQRLEGWECEITPQTQDTFRQLHSRVIGLTPARFWDWFQPYRLRDRNLADLIPPDRRSEYWR